MQNCITLTNGAIPYILNIKKDNSLNKEQVNIKTCLLRIEAINNKASSKGNILVLTLSDGVNKSSNFCFCGKEGLKVKDVIQFSTITISLLQNNHTLYVIKKIDQLYQQPIVNEIPTENVNYSHNNNIMHNNNNYNDDNEYNMSQYTPLSSLTTFTKSFKIYFKLISKSDIHKYTNAKGEGQVLSFNLQDKDGYEMQGTVFGDACDKLNNLLHKGKYYETKSGYIRMSRRKGGPNCSDYCIIFDDNSLFTEMPEICKFQHAQINLSSIPEIYDHTPGAVVDILAVVTNASEIRVITLKNSNQTRDTRKLTLGDATGNSIELTLWGENANNDFNINEIFLFRKLRIHEFRDVKSLNSTEDTEIIHNPKLEQSEQLKHFLINGGVFKQAPVYSSTNETITSEKLFLDQIYANVDDIYGREQSSDPKVYPVVRFKGVVVSISKYDKNYYYGCPEKNCKKKLMTDINSNYKCTKCGTDVGPEGGVFYYTLSACVQDATMSCWVELFGETAERLLGVECRMYHEYASNNDEAKIGEIHDEVMYRTFVFVGKGKKVVVPNNNVCKTRISVFSVFKVNEENEVKVAKERAMMYKQLLK